MDYHGLNGEINSSRWPENFSPPELHADDSKHYDERSLAEGIEKALEEALGLKTERGKPEYKH